MLADRVTEDTTIAKQQIDLATRMTLEQVSRLLDGDYEQSVAIQLFLDCIDRATTPSTAFVSFREQPMHFNSNQTLSLRVVDPISDEGGWTMRDDGCHSCCHGNGNAHFDVAAPGFDYVAASTANTCGAELTGFDSKEQSAALGDWWTNHANTAQASTLCGDLPEAFQAGCMLFASWGWTTGNPQRAKYKAVTCPQAFISHVQGLFDEGGPTGQSTPSLRHAQVQAHATEHDQLYAIEQSEDMSMLQLSGTHRDRVNSRYSIHVEI